MAVTCRWSANESSAVRMPQVPETSVTSGTEAARRRSNAAVLASVLSVEMTMRNRTRRGRPSARRARRLQDPRAWRSARSPVRRLRGSRAAWRRGAWRAPAACPAPPAAMAARRAGRWRGPDRPRTTRAAGAPARAPPHLQMRRPRRRPPGSRPRARRGWRESSSSPLQGHRPPRAPPTSSHPKATFGAGKAQGEAGELANWRTGERESRRMGVLRDLH